MAKLPLTTEAVAESSVRGNWAASSGRKTRPFRFWSISFSKPSSGSMSFLIVIRLSLARKRGPRARLVGSFDKVTTSPFLRSLIDDLVRVQTEACGRHADQAGELEPLVGREFSR